MGDLLPQLEREAWELVRPLVRSGHVGLVLDAMLVGNAPGQVWVDDGAKPRSVFMWDGGHNFYLAGASENRGFNAELKRLFEMDISPEGKRRGLGSFKVNCDDGGWNSGLGALFSTLMQRNVGRCFLRLGRQQLAGGGVPVGFELRDIDAEWLDAGFAGVAGVRHEVESMWGTVAAFLEDGFGVAVVHQGQVVCWCTAEYLSRGRCGIGIETVEKQRGKGLATAAAAAFAAKARGRGLEPHWDSWADNWPSLAVARKLGFERVEEYAVGVGRFL